VTKTFGAKQPDDPHRSCAVENSDCSLNLDVCVWLGMVGKGLGGVPGGGVVCPESQGGSFQVGVPPAVLLFQHPRGDLAEEGDEAAGRRGHLLLPELLVQRQVLRGIMSVLATCGGGGKGGGGTTGNTELTARSYVVHTGSHV